MTKGDRVKFTGQYGNTGTVLWIDDTLVRVQPDPADGRPFPPITVRALEVEPIPVPKVVSPENEIIAKAYISAAEAFETFASDQIASKRYMSLARDKATCDTKAAVWTDAAKMLREAAAKQE